MKLAYWCLVGNGWEWGNGIINHSYYGSFPHSLLGTSKLMNIDKIVVSYDKSAQQGQGHLLSKLLYLCAPSGDNVNRILVASQVSFISADGHVPVEFPVNFLHSFIIRMIFMHHFWMMLPQS